MSIPQASPSGSTPDFGIDLDYDGEPILRAPEIRRLDGVVREVAIPPLVAPAVHGSLADLPFDRAETQPELVVLSRKTEDDSWIDVTAAEFAAQVHAVAKGLIAEGLVPGDRVAVMARTRYEWTLLDFAAWAMRPGDRPRLPHLLRLPGPLDPPGLRRGRPGHRDRRAGRRHRPRARTPARPAPYVGHREGPCGPAGGAGRAGAGPGGGRTPRDAGPRHHRHPRLHLGHDRASPRAARSATATSSPRSTTRSNSCTRSSRRGRAKRRRFCCSCRCRMSSAGWWRSHASGREYGWVMRRA